MVRSVVPSTFEITGAKHKALFALLATAPFGRRTRSFLQNTLWGTACYDTGRQSLRRALADIKQVMGDSFSKVLSSTNAELTLDLAKVSFIGRPGSGAFLEGLDLREAGFAQWVAGVRSHPDQLHGLFSLTSQSSPPSILPTVAVLPLRSISGDPGEAALGDWLAEEACRSLSRSRLLAVISHLSCRELVRQVFDIAAVEARLRADFCVAGTIRSAGANVIVDADFIDVRTSAIIWTRQFCASRDEFNSLVAEPIKLIVQAVGSAIADLALTHIAGRVVTDIDDHRLVVAAVRLMHRPTLREFARSRELLEEARRRAPYSSEIHAWLGKWHVLSVFNRWSTDEASDTQQALDCTARALDISPDNSFSLTIDGFAQNNLLRRLDVAEHRYEAALEANPNEALSWLLKGALHTFRDEGSQAVNAVSVARRLSPIDPFGHYYDALSAGAHLAADDPEESLRLADRAIAANDRHLSILRIKIGALHRLDRLSEARAVASELLRRQPAFQVDDYLKSHPSGGFRIGQQMAAALRASGIP
ncbi:MAG: hypothetical protein Q8O26_18985 [Phreatobacter sp.]|uniref:tetratricopeptide repeat protein n=1 Tax=Phreatobacter sp. TaxID=1966341 RepID=UPI002732376C|nr:hypothetical protein [Phreatobacter sp.]MDP2803963.1 hypothetical protein [Phreatobacter sp.]